LPSNERAMSLVALGVTGGIGAYKAVEIARGLQQAGHDVVAVMTRAATRFVGPLTFEAITRRKVITGQFEPGANADIAHVNLAATIEALLVAPATANIIGKFAGGIADDFLTSLYLATRAPVILAPAMNTNMWEHPAVIRNLEVLRTRGVHVVEPGEGFLACGWTGKGRLAEPADVVRAVDTLLRPARTLTGRRALVTAGPTYEDLDPVRFLGNRSSGRMGFALAAEADARGAAVCVIAGPTRVEPPGVAEVVRVRSAAEMHAEVLARAADVDVIIMAAAVADYMPEHTHTEKVAKLDAPLTLRLTRTPDILGDLGRLRAEGRLPRPLLIGFAAETSDLIAKARVKLRAKHADLIVANDVSAAGAGFDVETNAVTIVTAEGEQAWPVLPKRDVARIVMDRVEALLARLPEA
jgi:phosphopantothenoylcysteine decarboxylase / phosphopantothenate---cysteine ligase